MHSAAERKREMTLGSGVGSDGDKSAEIEAAAATLRNAGWLVLPPPSAEIPEPQAGQVWVSPKPRVEPRTVVKIGPNKSYGWAGEKCVFFKSKSKPGNPWGPSCLNPEGWIDWARKSGARPV